MSIIGQERRATFTVKDAPATGRRAVMSSAKVDRVGDIIDQAGWMLDEFAKNPVMLYEHDRTMPVGVWRDVKIEGGALTGEPVWHPGEINPLAGRLAALYAGQWLRAFSVGFRVLEAEPIPDGQGWLIKKAELFECSCVAIPANSDALLKSAPGAKIVPVYGPKSDLPDLLARRDVAAIGKWVAPATPLRVESDDMDAILNNPDALRRLKAALGALTDEQPAAQTAPKAGDDGAAAGAEKEDLTAEALAAVSEATDAVAELMADIEEDEDDS